MSTSQNGWPVVESGTDARLVAIPKVLGRVRRGDVADVLGYLVEQFDRRVEDVDAGRDDWGYAYRAIRGKSSGYSNHASGTALDLNATQHVLGRRGTFTRAQLVELRAILAELGGVVRWGGDYAGRADEMHFEINASAAAVGAVAARIRAGRPHGPTPTTPEAPEPPAIPDDDMEILDMYPFIIRATDQDAWTLVLSPSKQVAIPSADVKANRAAIVAAFGDPRTVGATTAAGIRSHAS